MLQLAVVLSCKINIRCIAYVLIVCAFWKSNKGKGKGLDTCYSATYMSQTRDQQHFTISEVAADWHEPIVAKLQLIVMK